MINPIYDIGSSISIAEILHKNLNSEEDLLVAEPESQLASIQKVSSQVGKPEVLDSTRNSNSNMMSRNFAQADTEESKHMKARKASMSASTSLQNQQQVSMAGVLGQMAVNTIVSIQESGDAYTLAQSKRHMQAAKNAPRITRLYELQKNGEAMESSRKHLSESRNSIEEAARQSSEERKASEGQVQIASAPAPAPSPDTSHQHVEGSSSSSEAAAAAAIAVLAPGDVAESNYDPAASLP